MVVNSENVRCINGYTFDSRVGECLVMLKYQPAKIPTKYGGALVHGLK